MTKIIINDVEFEVDELRIGESDDVGIKEVSFEFSVIGKSEYYLYKEFFDRKDFMVTIPNNDCTFTATIPLNSASYKGELDENVQVNFNITLREKSKEDEKKNSNLFSNMASESISQRLRFRALLEALEEKGILSMDEYIKKFDEVEERDYEIVKLELFKGIQNEDEE